MRSGITGAFRPINTRNIVYIRDLIVELVRRDMKLRYKGSILGIAWSLLNPLAQLVVFTIIFTWVLPLDIPNYGLFLFCALLPWTWFQTSWTSATETIVEGRALIKRPGFPPGILPVVSITSNLIHFLLALPVLIGFMLIVNVPLTVNVLFLPVLITIQFLVILSISYITAAVHVQFRDTQHLVGVVVLLLFYLSPVFYDMAMVPAQLLPLYALNPLVPLLDGYRAIFLRGDLPNMSALSLLAITSTALLYFSHRFFMRMSYVFVEEL
jgi:lipopolysaccharide transport system permease protein